MLYEDNDLRIPGTVALQHVIVIRLNNQLSGKSRGNIVIKTIQKRVKSESERTTKRTTRRTKMTTRSKTRSKMRRTKEKSVVVIARRILRSSLRLHSNLSLIEVVETKDGGMACILYIIV